MNPKAFQRDFLEKMAPEASAAQLFDHIPGYSFFMKNAHFQLIASNRSFRERLGLSEEGLIGKNDFELFPPHLAEHFRSDDTEVLSSGQPKLFIVELFFDSQGLPDWFQTNKYPVMDRGGQVIGLMGTTRKLRKSQGEISSFAGVDKAVDHLRSHYANPITIADLAYVAGLSPRQFHRKFKDAFNLSPQSFLIKTRIQAACRALRTSDTPLSDLAVDIGFYDQSSFIQHFKKHMGMTPLQYRKQHPKSEESPPRPD